MDINLTIKHLKWHHNTIIDVCVQFRDYCSTPSYLIHQKCQKVIFKFSDFAHDSRWPSKTRKRSIVALYTNKGGQLSQWAIVVLYDLGGQLSQWAIVQRVIVQWVIVAVSKCHCEQLSVSNCRESNCRVSNCLSEQLSGWANVEWAIVEWATVRESQFA